MLFVFSIECNFSRIHLAFYKEIINTSSYVCCSVISKTITKPILSMCGSLLKIFSKISFFRFFLNNLIKVLFGFWHFGSFLLILFFWHLYSFDQTSEEYALKVVDHFLPFIFQCRVFQKILRNLQNRIVKPEALVKIYPYTSSIINST